jgi:hypothetical protein
MRYGKHSLDENRRIVMYCPKCGEKMKPGEQTWVCVSGNMELSEWLYHGLNEVFLTGSSTIEQ